MTVDAKRKHHCLNRLALSFDGIGAQATQRHCANDDGNHPRKKRHPLSAVPYRVELFDREGRSIGIGERGTIPSPPKEARVVVDGNLDPVWPGTSKIEVWSVPTGVTVEPVTRWNAQR